MGLAASQARFLQLTARRSNIEFMGQQINQQRLTLANQSAGLFQRQLALVAPTPPTSSSETYTTPAYSFTCAVTGVNKTIKFVTNALGVVTGAYITYNVTDPGTGVSSSKTVSVLGTPATGSGDNVSNGLVNSSWTTDITFDSSTSRLNQLNLSVWDISSGAAVSHTYSSLDLTYAPIFDEAKYNDDMNKYEYQKTQYDQQVELINAQTADIQHKDVSLELKMKQLDTEHTSIQTEIEAVQKVLQTNIEGSFKTFS